MMSKGRLEAFSDGVFAIVITLLVLDIRLPEVEVHSSRELAGSLVRIAPAIITYVFSFLVVGVFWMAHHRIFSLVRSVDHFLLWSNIFYLLVVAIIPFPASVLAHHPFFTTSIIFYCSILVLCGMLHFVLLYYVWKHSAYKEAHFSRAVYRSACRVAAVGPACYLLAIPCSFIHPVISFFFIAAALVFYIFFAPRYLWKKV